MSKKDGKVYIIIYEVGKIAFHHPYVYKTLEGAVDHMKELGQREWYMNNMRLMVCTNPPAVDDGQYYVVGNNSGGYDLVPIDEGSAILYGQ